MGMRGWGVGIVVALVVWVRLASASKPFRVSPFTAVCPVESASDSILRFRNRNCPLNGDSRSLGLVAATEDQAEKLVAFINLLVSKGNVHFVTAKGDELSLLLALNMVHTNSHQYVAVLFYASWCPFSRTFRPIFSVLSLLYPSIPHYAIEESKVRPSILSKYGVHGFPTVFLLNSTMRVHYLGSRTLTSLIAFYIDVTGINMAPLDLTSLEKVVRPSNHEKNDNTKQESCAFSWARSPEKLLQQETYLVLATAFVLLRLLYFYLPTVLLCAQCAWRGHIRNMRLGSLWEHPLAYLKCAIQLFNSLKEPCKRSNLQEGAMNARAWASKSLATVSIGDAGTCRGLPGGECH